jgi:hypothetical protein
VLSASEVAWVALLPCVAAVVLAIVVLGPPLGRALFPHGSDQLWPPGWWEAAGQAEPVKEGRFVVAALAPALLAGAILLGRGRRLTLRPAWLRPIVFADYAVVLLLVGIALLDQNVMSNNDSPAPALVGLGAVAAAGALVVAGLAAMRTRRMAALAASLARETTVRRWAALAVVLALLAVWLLKAVQTEGVIGDEAGPNLSWTMNDAFAVLDGRTPLVDYHPIYAKLMPYPAALALATFGTTIFVYTTFMAVLSGLVLLAVYGTFRLVTRSSLLALGLLVPFVATSDVNPGTSTTGLGSPITIPALWPMRYGGVYLLAWLTARQIAGRRPRGQWILAFVGTVAAVNSPEFGAPALLATVAALLCTQPPHSRRDVTRLAVELAGGAAAGVVLVALGTLAVSGGLPKLGLLLEWPRAFSSLGLLSMPLPTWGLHLAIYATFVAALATAVVRLSQQQDGRTLTGMLAWSGVFGLFAGSYFVGRPDVYKLTSILSAWGFALALLTVACVLALSARGWRRPTPAHLLVLFGFGLSLCALSGLPQPQEQIARLTKRYPQPRYEVAAERFVRRHARSGEAVAVLLPMGSRISYAVGVHNVAPYAFMNAIVTRRAMGTLIATLQRDRVRTVFVPQPGAGRLLGEGEAAPEQLQALADIGFQQIDAAAGMVALRKLG